MEDEPIPAVDLSRQAQERQATKSPRMTGRTGFGLFGGPVSTSAGPGPRKDGPGGPGPVPQATGP